MAIKILIVEDDGIFASILGIKLKKWGYEVPKIVLTGHEAVKHAKKVEPDIIIMNIFLKGKLDGIEASKLIDAEFKIPIIYYSAKNEEELSERIKNLPNRDYISKTCEDEHLKLTIENNLRKPDLNKIKSTSDDKESLFAENHPNNIKIEYDHQNNILMRRDKNTDKIKSAKETEMPSKVNNHRNSDYNKVNENLNPIIGNNSRKDGLNYVNDIANGTEISALKKTSDEHPIIPQKLEHKPKNSETFFSKISNKSVREIRKLKTIEKKHISSIRGKDKKIEELEKHRVKLEEKLNIYKKQRKKILNEMHGLKDQIDAFISILES